MGPDVFFDILRIQQGAIRHHRKSKPLSISTKWPQSQVFSPCLALFFWDQWFSFFRCWNPYIDNLRGCDFLGNLLASQWATTFLRCDRPKVCRCQQARKVPCIAPCNAHSNALYMELASTSLDTQSRMESKGTKQDQKRHYQKPGIKMDIDGLSVSHIFGVPEKMTWFRTHERG